MASQYLPFLMQHILQSQEEEEETPSPSRPVPGAAILQRQPPQALPPVAPGQVPGVSDPTAAIQQRGFEAAGIPSSQEAFQRGIEAQRSAALAKHGDPTHKPMGPPDLRAPLNVLDETAEGMRQSRRAEAESNIGPGAVEFAPGQFYKGPSRVTGTARSGSGRKGTVNLPPASNGRGTVSSPVIRDEQGNQKEFFSSRPEVARDQKLQRAQQNAAIAQAEAAEEQFRQSGQGEPQPPEDAVANLILQGLLQKYQADGDIDAFTQGLNQLFQTMRRFSPDQLFAFPGAAATTEG